MYLMYTDTANQISMVVAQVKSEKSIRTFILVPFFTNVIPMFYYFFFVIIVG